MKDVTFGQYYPVKSFVHKMDPRAKIVFTLCYIIFIFFVKNFWGFLAAAAYLALAIGFSRVKVTSVLRSIKAVLFLVIFTLVINVFFYGGETVLVHWKFIKITKEALVFSAFMALRLTLLVMGTSVLTLTTTPVSLTDGIESLLLPLKWVRFPVHELALIMSIALRFIPTLMEETDRIICAQKARGADFESGNLFKRAKAMIPVLIPLLVSSFKRAEELGDAMDARCYRGSKGRTKYKKLRYGWRDLIGFLATGALIAGIFLLNHYLGRV